MADVLQITVDALDDRRALDITVLDLHEVSQSLDYFVVATGESNPQLKAMQEEVRSQLKPTSAELQAIEGPSDRWILMDYGALVIHLMSPDAREFYDLEGLWADAKVLDLQPSDTPSDTPSNTSSDAPSNTTITAP